MKYHIRQKIKNQISRIKANYQSHYRWRNVPSAVIKGELDLSKFGGAQLFIADINGDNKNEFLWLQSQGIYKSKLHSNDSPAIKASLEKTGQSIFCLTATNIHGDIIWQVGLPYNGTEPYLSHATEQMVEIADVDGDGAVEVLVINSSNELLILNGPDGQTKKIIDLPADNFATVKTGVLDPDTKERTIIVGVTDKGYFPHSYGNPWLFIDPSLQIVAEKDYIGSGHQVAVIDANDDRVDEFFIGYQLIDSKSDVIWTVDEWKDCKIDAQEQHVDSIDIYKNGDDWFAAIAGSDKQYWIDKNGSTVWSKNLPHPQFCLIGKSSDPVEVFVLNQRIQMNCFDQNGLELWEGLLDEHWPKGKPLAAVSSRPIHCNVPAIEVNLDNRTNMFLYKEGGWPYIVDFRGNILFRFPFDSKYSTKNFRSPIRRINDLGLAYEAETYLDSESGNLRFVIYNRDWAWFFEIPSES